MLANAQGREAGIAAIGIGAYDCHRKPVERDLLELTIRRAFDLPAKQQTLGGIRQVQPDAPLPGIVTRDARMLALCRDAERMAADSGCVMLIGEPGTGKTVLARAMHALGRRPEQRFVTLNCAAMSEALLEEELFGAAGGALNIDGAPGPGLHGLAPAGTRLLDDVGELPMALQVRLLRFLQARRQAGHAGRAAQGEASRNDSKMAAQLEQSRIGGAAVLVLEQPRIGGAAALTLEPPRFVCESSQDLAALARQGRFLPDLADMLGELVLTLAPLRTRAGDPALLAHHFMKRFAACYGRPPMVLSEAAHFAIEEYGWPGNVRELEVCIRNAVIMSAAARIGVLDLGLPGAAQPNAPLNLRQVRDAAEYRVIVLALERAGGCIAKAAELLGVSRPTVYDLMNYHGIRV